MYAADTQPVLRCVQCNKPFDKESTLKRHGYYCRSRRQGSVPRSHSCLPCAKAKVRCDTSRPECLRCLSKAITCEYKASRSGIPREGVQHSDHRPERQKKPNNACSPATEDIPFDISWSNDSNGFPVLDPALDLLESDFSDPAMNYLDADIDFNYDKPLLAYDPPNQQLTASPTLSLQPTSPSAIRTFHHRPKLNTSTQRTATLILHILKSYPLTILRDNNLPPFIHPSLLHPSSPRNTDMQYLTNCFSLTHILNNNLPSTRKLFWRNVRQECEELCSVYAQLNEWQLLAAMQALSIYIVIRLDEGETEYNNCDALLVTSVMAVATQFNNMGIDHSHNPALSWEDWVLVESARRLCVVYQVVNMLVYFKPAAMCDMRATGLLLAPLPANKQLWEASDEFNWKNQRRREGDTYVLSVNGDLVITEGGNRVTMPDQ